MDSTLDWQMIRTSALWVEEIAPALRERLAKIDQQLRREKGEKLIELQGRALELEALLGVDDERRERLEIVRQEQEERLKENGRGRTTTWFERLRTGGRERLGG